MEIAVVGNCQSYPLALCLMAMAPDVAARAIVANRTTEITDDLTACDLVFTTLLDDARLEDVIPQLTGRVFQYPRITYTAFTPDSVYATSAGKMIKSPVGDYHSSLIVYAWLHGLSVRETKALFCTSVFERLSFAQHQGLSRALMLREGEKIGFPMAPLLDKWQAGGRFMHSVNHPRLLVMADIARVLAERSGINAQMTRPEDYVADPLMSSCVWPVYPGLNPQWESFASYDFKGPREFTSAGRPVKVFPLEGFIEGSLEAYKGISQESVSCPQVENLAYRGLDEWARRATSTVSLKTSQGKRNHPYVGLPRRQFWRSAVSEVPAEAVDPIDDPPFVISSQMKVATAGSCFAQHIAAALKLAGFNYFVSEPSPPDLSQEEAARRQYGLFSARYGNIYTTRQLLQLYDRAYGAFKPDDGAWVRPDGRYVDPFRPAVEPDGFATEEAVIRSRDRHLETVRHLFEQLNILVITLGLTEAWRSRSDGAVVPLAPGVAADPPDRHIYEFVNFSVAEVGKDLEEFQAKLKEVNPRARIILTVSPVPLAATFEHRHVLTATTYSKAVLRVAAEQIAQGRDDVMYFPAYEIITGNYGHASHFEEDMRTVRQSSVNQVMDLFLRHCTDRSDVVGTIESIQRVICDEEQLVYT
jgi:GSCFA family/Polysaccharide biosynthesis enzyme WcbI